MHVRVAFGQAIIRPPNMASLSARTWSGAAHAVHCWRCMFLLRISTGGSDCLPVWYRAACALLRYHPRSFTLAGSTSNLESGSASLPFSTKEGATGRNGSFPFASAASHRNPRMSLARVHGRFETLRCRSARYRVRRPTHAPVVAMWDWPSLVTANCRNMQCATRRIQRHYASQGLWCTPLLCISMLMVPCIFYVHVRRRGNIYMYMQVVGLFFLTTVLIANIMVLARCKYYDFYQV